MAKTSGTAWRFQRGLSGRIPWNAHLALRFGLVDHFSETAEGLPILMDDILVNFDDRRAARAARAIESLAERHQIIYFTCHPETPLRDGTEIALPALETVSQANDVQSLASDEGGERHGRPSGVRTRQ